MTAFLALYQGASIGDARMVAVTADSAVVQDFAGRLLDEHEDDQEDAVLGELEDGRRRALRLVRDGGSRD